MSRADRDHDDGHEPTDDPNRVTVTRATLAGLHLDVAAAEMTADELALHVLVLGGPHHDLRMSPDAAAIVDKMRDRIGIR